MSKRTIGVIGVIISAVFFGFVPTFSTYLTSVGGTTLSVVFLRFSLSLIPLLIYLKAKKIPMGITKSQFWKLVLITVAGYGGTAPLLFSSYSFIPTGMATTLHFCYPAMVIVFSAIFLKEKIKPVKLICVIMCMAGIFLFYDVGMGGNIIGILLAFISGNTYAFYIIYLDKSELKEMDSLKMIFYMNAIGTVMFFIICLATGQLALAMPWSGWLVAAVFSVGASFIAVLGFQIGVKYTGGQSASILSTFEPITSVVIGVAAHGESFSARGIAGCVLILAATVIIACVRDEEPARDGLMQGDEKNSAS